jgi:hypothetical protein
MRCHVRMFIAVQVLTQRAAASTGAVWRGARTLAGPRGNGAARLGFFITDNVDKQIHMRYGLREY